MSGTVEINIGDNLLKAITKIIDVVDKENARCDATICPGVAIQKAFGLNLTRVHENELLELRKRIDL